MKSLRSDRPEQHEALSLGILTGGKVTLSRTVSFDLPVIHTANSYAFKPDSNSYCWGIWQKSSLML